MAAKLRKGDKVVVLAGKDKGREGEITRVMPKDNKAVVAGDERGDPPPAPDPGRPRAAGSPRKCRSTCRTSRCSTAAGKATRVGFRMDGDKKVRFAKTTGEAI